VETSTALIVTSQVVVFNKNDNSIKSFTRRISKGTYDPVYVKNDLDYFCDFPLMNSDGYFLYYDNCIYSFIEAKDFHDSYEILSKKPGNSFNNIKSMTSFLDNVSEFDNPVIVKVHLK
jgi:hypothetical protein